MPPKFKYSLISLVALLALVFSYSVFSLNFKKPVSTSIKIDGEKTQGAKTSNQQSPTILKTTTETTTEQIFKVIRVIDGDTIEISAIGGPASGGEGGQRVRYIGIDTPETVDPRETVQCFGQEAASKNKELVEGKNVTLEKDVSETDKYGRLLRYVYIEGVMVNDLLVRQGYATSSSYPPDIKYQNQLLQAQQEAEQNKLGLWSACNSSYKAPVQTFQNQQPPDANCIVKGNISSNGKIYHMPGQYYYNKTQIDQSQGERWFCTEEDAQAAGWRKSKK